MPREEGFAQQKQVVFFGEWYADDVTAEAYPVSIKLEALLRRYSWKKVPQNYSRISYGLDGQGFLLLIFHFGKYANETHMYNTCFYSVYNVVYLRVLF